ncbi:MAG: hypothetical protein RIS41_2261 [Actinomycetota bacterium]
MSRFRDLIAHPDVEEVCVLRGHTDPREQRIGFMAYHGGGLEEMTEVVAQVAAERSRASYYGVHQPHGMEDHIPSIDVSPDHSPALASFIAHVHTVVTIHGYGRRGFFSSLLVGGRHRGFAEHIGTHLRQHLPAYSIVTDIDRIPHDLRGLHSRNPVNLPPAAGVQIELPPRVRGSSPLWWDWEGPGPTPHTLSLIDALAEATRTWITD